MWVKHILLEILYYDKIVIFHPFFLRQKIKIHHDYFHEKKITSCYKLVLWWKMTCCHKFSFVVKSAWHVTISFIVEKLFIFAMKLSFMVKNNCLRTYSNKPTTNNFLWKKTFYHKIFSFNHKLINGKTPLFVVVWYTSLIHYLIT